MPEDMVVITKRSQIDEAIKLIDENIALQQRVNILQLGTDFYVHHEKTARQRKIELESENAAFQKEIDELKYQLREKTIKNMMLRFLNGENVDQLIPS